MKEYKGFRYQELSAGKWKIVLPSGIKSIIEAPSEVHLKARIDQLTS